ncbi:hypothetical protein PVK06_039811 [Gossypium arboreum]|uniref:Uncharacterized protein n=1 Tax=Gossypium arboreum TaxID=29729 RepID=A0ABR0N3V7_GOSAR|nr:hypothetical protein PVK06_039811 [Gossypium arboreum]
MSHPRNKLRDGFGFLEQWSIPSEPIYTHKKPLENEAVEEQFDHLKVGHSLVLESPITIINIFHLCLENQSLNGYEPTDIVVGVDPQVVHSTKKAWPYNTIDDLVFVLFGRKGSAQSYTSSQTSSNMDDNIIMERAQVAVIVVDVSVQPRSSSHNRPSEEEGSRNIDDSRGSRLVHHRRGKN